VKSASPNTGGSGVSTLTPSKWKEASDFIHSMTPEAKSAAKYHSDLLKKVNIDIDIEPLTIF